MRDWEELLGLGKIMIDGKRKDWIIGRVGEEMQGFQGPTAVMIEELKEETGDEGEVKRDRTSRGGCWAAEASPVTALSAHAVCVHTLCVFHAFKH